jgi:hypothetical protein
MMMPCIAEAEAYHRVDSSCCSIPLYMGASQKRPFEKVAQRRQIGDRQLGATATKTGRDSDTLWARWRQFTHNKKAQQRQIAVATATPDGRNGDNRTVTTATWFWRNGDKTGRDGDS